MSKIGRTPVKLAKGVNVSFENGNLKVKGPKGELTQEVVADIDFEIGESEIILKRKSEAKQQKAFHGLYRSLLNNMVQGVSEGFSKVLLIVGVGYKAAVEGNKLTMQLGYCHPIIYDIPEGITCKCETPTKIIISGIDKVKVGQVAADIRKFRKVEPYKGKGIRYEDEIVKRKAGKATK